MGRYHSRLVSDTLVRSLVVVVLDMLTDEMIEMLCPYRDEMIKALVFQ